MHSRASVNTPHVTYHAPHLQCNNQIVSYMAQSQRKSTRRELGVQHLICPMLGGPFEITTNVVGEVVNGKKSRFIKAMVLVLIVGFATRYNNYIHNSMHKLSYSVQSEQG